MSQGFNFGSQDVESMTADAQKALEQRAQETSSKPVQHAADLLKAQNEMMVDKELAERFERISKYMQDIKRQAPGEFERTQRQIENMRPLLRLSLRSVDFRKTFMSFLRVLKHIYEENVDGSLESVLATGEKQGIKSATQEVKQIGRGAVSRGQNKQKIIPDQDWKKISSELDQIFTELNQHRDYQNGIHALFELPSTFTEEVENKYTQAVEQLKEESKDLIAQFSGRKSLDQLFDRIQKLTKDLERNHEAQQWWRDFKDIVERIAKNYSGEQDLDELRAHFNKSSEVFDSLESYRPQVNKIIDSINEIYEKMSDDKYVKELQERLSIVADDLYWVDSEGNKRFDTQAAGELSSALGEMLRKQFEYFSLPDIQGDSNGAKYSLSNLNIQATLPEQMKFHLESDAILDTSRPTEDKPQRLQTELYLTASLEGIKLNANGIIFTYSSTMLTDNGVMDVTVPSANLCIDFVYSPSAPRDRTGYTATVGSERPGMYQFLRVRSTFTVSDLNISYHMDTLSHKLVVPMLTGLYKRYLTHQFETSIQDSLNEGLKEVGQRISNMMEQSPFPLSLNYSSGLSSFSDLKDFAQGVKEDVMGEKDRTQTSVH